jgi:hypothetical protein
MDGDAETTGVVLDQDRPTLREGTGLDPAGYRVYYRWAILVLLGLLPGVLLIHLGLPFLLFPELFVVFFRRFLHLLGRFRVIAAGVQKRRRGQSHAKDEERKTTFSSLHKVHHFREGLAGIVHQAVVSGQWLVGSIRG